jgi:putative transposase
MELEKQKSLCQPYSTRYVEIIVAPVPIGLKRYYGSQDLHFITCSCYQRRPWLGTPARRTLFLNVLEQVRVAYDFTVIGYMVMPEHIHLLLSEPDEGDLSRVMQVLKQRVARRVLTAVRRRKRPDQAGLWDAKPEHFWQRRFYDFNVWSDHKRIEKLRYMHRNPGRRGLVLDPDQWPWSSFRSYAYHEPGLVLINAPGSAKLKIRRIAA